MRGVYGFLVKTAMVVIFAPQEIEIIRTTFHASVMYIDNLHIKC
jgi:hypothetical protein